MAALKCGHLYGNSCITTWIKDNKNCPSCKSKALSKDLRFIYATKVQIVDNSRENELELELQKLQQEKRDLTVKSGENAMTIALQRRQIKELAREIERLKSFARSNSNDLASFTIRSGRMYLEKTIEFKENADCRIIKFMSKIKKLVISQKAVASSLFAGYGVRFVDVLSHRSEKFINTSSKQIIDISFDSSETFISSASREPVVKVFNINTSQTIASLSPSNSPIWSCSFNKNRENQIFLGSQDGTLYMYDIKQPNQNPQIARSLENKTPVKLILSVTKNESFKFGGFFVIHLRGLYFYEYKQDLNFEITKLNYDDAIVTASYDDRTELLLLSTPADEKITHIALKLIKVDEVPVLQESYRYQTNQSGICLSRPAQIKFKESYLISSYCSDSRDIQLYSPDIGKLHTMTMQNPVLDICPIYTDNSSTSFAALSSTKCRIFKVNLE